VKRPSILVVDDERLIRWSIAAELQERGYETREAESADKARLEIERGVDAVVLDDELPGVDTLELLRELAERSPELPVIVLTGSNGSTPQPLREAAAHLVEKPFEPRQVGAAIAAVCQIAPAGEAAEEDREESIALDRLRGSSHGIAELKRDLVRVAKGSARAIVVRGEEGTGRHLAARVIHELSDRAERPLRRLAGSHASHEALEAIVGECEGGTLLVEGIDGLSAEVQEGLIRFFETRSETRVVVLAGPDLPIALSRGTLREDLHELLAAARVRVPSLRERDGDVPILAQHFVVKLSGMLDTPVRDIDDSALAALEQHAWPRNIRELRDTIERAMVLATRPTLCANDFARLDNGMDAAVTYTLPPGGIDLKQLERNLVIQALERTGGNRTRAAELLRMTRDQMRYRVTKFNLD
jgi:DNA-binding NtrC family response regulator